MKRNLKNGLVFAHRWFRTGEGWAYHPDLELGFPDLTDKISVELQNRDHLSGKEWHTFKLPLRGGEIVGIHKLDLVCSDPRAKGRSPSVLIAVFVGKGMRVKQESLVAELAELIPEVGGPDSRFKLKTFEMNKNLWRKWIVRGTIALITIGSLVAVVSSIAGDQYRERKRDVCNTMLELVPTAEVSSEDNESYCWERFCHVFCQPSPLPSSLHPDVQWVGSLLFMPDGLGGKGGPQDFRWKFYVDAINEWAEQRNLTNKLKKNASGSDASDLLREIIATIDYQPWVQKQMMSNPKFRQSFCVGSNAVSDLRKQALETDRWEHLLNCWQRDYAQSMFEQLSSWDVQEVEEDDLESRPWFVIQAFFAFLNRERFQSLKEAPTPYDLFVKRLPATNLLHDVKYDVTLKQTVDDALNELVKAICGSIPSLQLDQRSASKRIGEALDYKNWQTKVVQDLKKKKLQAGARDDGKQYMDADKKLCKFQDSVNSRSAIPGVNDFVKRFQDGGNK